MSFKTFMGSIGNAFKTGWRNGNLQKGIAATGMAAFGIGMTGAMIHDMKRSSGSIFGGCGCNSFGMGGLNMYGCSPFGLGGMNLYGSGMDLFGGMSLLNGMGNPYNTQMGNMMAYQWGQQLATQYQAQQASLYSSINNPIYNTTGEVTDEMLDKIAPAHDFEDAEGDTGADKKKGEAFDTGTDALKSDSDADPVVLSDKKISEGKDAYVKGLSDTAKSYIATLDTDDEDGLVSEDEFIEQEIEKARAELEAKGEELTDDKETNLRNSLKIVFAKMDLNRSGYIDWKEMTSTMATYDTGGKALGSSGGNGKISASEYKKAQDSLTSANGGFGKANWANYKRLFGNPETE